MKQSNGKRTSEVKIEDVQFVADLGSNGTKHIKHYLNRNQAAMLERDIGAHALTLFIYYLDAANFNDTQAELSDSYIAEALGRTERAVADQRRTLIKKKWLAIEPFTSVNGLKCRRFYLGKASVAKYEYAKKMVKEGLNGVVWDEDAQAPLDVMISINSGG